MPDGGLTFVGRFTTIRKMPGPGHRSTMPGPMPFDHMPGPTHNGMPGPPRNSNKTTLIRAPAG